jgi:flagellar basal-body rod modification protein FlgD
MATSTTSSTNITGYESIAKATTSSTKTTTQKALGKEDFLKMLVAQLKNQDPLNPMDGTDFTAQLAQFSSLEQLSNLNTQIQNQTLSMTSMAHSQAVNMIGKSVTVSGTNTLTANGQPLDIGYSLDGDASQVIISILDKLGNVVETLNASDQKSGQNSITWDMSAGTKGDYTFQVLAKDASGNDVTANASTKGTVEAVQFKDNQIYLIVNGQQVPFSDVTHIAQAT